MGRTVENDLVVWMAININIKVFDSILPQKVLGSYYYLSTILPQWKYL